MGSVGKNKLFSADSFCAAASRLNEVPGRGLEPLRISPPDPKSGASANFATPANCDAHEGRFVHRVRQIALVSVLGFLRQIGRWQHKRQQPVFLPIIIGTPQTRPSNWTGGKFRFR